MSKENNVNKEDKYVVYCNQTYLERDLFMDNKCQFCGCAIKSSFGNVCLAESSVFEIRCDDYARMYCLCKGCGKKIIDRIEHEQRQISRDMTEKETIGE